MEFGDNELLKAMGLKLGNHLEITGEKALYLITLDAEVGGIALVSKDKKMPLNWLIGKGYIVVYAFVLSEEEKVVVKLLKEFTAIRRDDLGVLSVKHMNGHWERLPFGSLFTFIQRGEEYPLDTLNEIAIKERLNA